MWSDLGMKTSWYLFRDHVGLRVRISWDLEGGDK